MSKFYDTLVALPLKSFSGIAGVIGIGAALWPTWFEEKIGAQVTADTLETLGLCLMAVSVIYFALLWWLKPAAEVSPRSAQSSSGSGSPNIQSGGGDVNFYNAPPPPASTEERKNPYGTPSPSPYSGRAMKGLDRALRGVSSPEPDYPLVDMMRQVYGERKWPASRADQRAFVRKIDLEVADKISQQNASVWGRFHDTPLKSVGEHWDRGTFKHITNSLTVPIGMEGTTYKDLHFNKAEIDAIWPKPISTTNDEKP
ncbi:hypothetical protein N9D37_00265 [Erythrobacter sp.]|nr:hypothetical protein [Erythrobacter sp.]